MLRGDEWRCPYCQKLLFKVFNLRISQGSIQVKCKCKEIVELNASHLTYK